MNPDALAINFTTILKSPNMFTFIDKFKDQEAFDYHCETQHIKEAFDNLIPPLVDSMDIKLHHEISFDMS